MIVREGPLPMDAPPRSGTPRVSVIVPFLDTPSPFLEEAVQSVHSQTFREWEILLVNDGSGPEASSTAEGLASDDPTRIRLLEHPEGANRGVAASRSLGLRHARGDLLACLDSDDVWKPRKLEEQVRIMDAAPHVGMIFGRSLYWHSWNPDAVEEDYLHELGVPDGTEMAPGDFLLRFLRHQVIVPIPSAVMARAALVRSVGGFGDLRSIYEDQGFYARMSTHGIVRACADVWNLYRIHPGSACARADRGQRRTARAEFLDQVHRQLLEDGVMPAPLRRTLRIERWATRVPWGPQVVRLLRQLGA